VLTARENMLLPMKLAGSEPSPEWMDEVIGKLGLSQRLDHLPHELSGGQQQRVAVARALLPQPDVIFADEPTGNLDSRSGTEVLGLLRTSVRETGQTVVMVTHDPVAASYADRVVLIADGRIAGEIDHPTVDSVIGAMRALGADDLADVPAVSGALR
jgi:putative ABC transport system ATP-binding protein